MTSTRRKIYIAVIILCFLATGGVLYFGLRAPVAPPAPAGGTHTSVPNDSNNIINTPGSGPKVGTGRYGTPQVFPADTKFDWTLLEADAFKTLKPIPDLVLDPATVGRTNPFSN